MTATIETLATQAVAENWSGEKIKKAAKIAGLPQHEVKAAVRSAVGEKYTVSALGKFEFILRDRTITTKDQAEAVAFADSVVRDWRSQGYAGGAQLVGGPTGLIHAYGREFR